MNKILLFLVLFAGMANAQNVNIPDSVFKSKLLSSSPTNTIAQNNMGNNIAIDINSDGEISIPEAMAVYGLDISNPYNSAGPFIVDLTGIDSFPNLRTLNCAHHQIPSIDFTFLGSLITLNCSYNQLTALDIPFAPQLQNLNCAHNDIAVLDVSEFTMLTHLNVIENELATIDLSTLSGLSQLHLGGNNFTNIDVSANTNLILLDCPANSLSSIDLTGLDALESLNIGGNLFSSVDLTPVPNLKQLDIYNNQFTSIDLSPVPLLENFSASENQFSSLDFTGLSQLQMIMVGFNNLTTLDLTHTPEVWALLCENNQITNLDLTVLPHLGALICENNLLTTIDGSQSQLINLDCSNNPIETIFLKNGSMTTPTQTLDLSNLPDLQYICVDEGEESLFLQAIIDLGYTNTAVSTYCSFTPGGDFNTITGSILFDGNNNGCGTGDMPQPNLKLAITGGSAPGATFSTGNGNYNFFTQTGSFTVTPQVENPSFFNFSPASATSVFPNTDNNVATHDFCVTANGVHPDVEIVIAPVDRARPGFDAHYKIVYRNKGNQILSGDVTFNYDDSVLDLEDVSVIPDSESSGELHWNYTGLLPFEVRVIFLTLNVNGPMETPAVNLDDILSYSVIVTSTTGDDMPGDNQFTLNQTVVNAFDPNSVTCLEGESVDPSNIGNYLHYIIDFENLGNAEAENVVVRIDVDPTLYDINSLQMMDTSHSSYSKVTGNIIEFIFENINLAPLAGDPPVGGHGNVLFKIKSNNALITGDAVNKLANIFFDYNYPIETNEAETVFQSLSTPGFSIDNSIKMYPNPTQGNVNIQSDNIIRSVSIFDIQGRVLQTILGNDTNFQLDVSDKSDGIYFLKITSNTGEKVEKLIKK